MLFRVPLCCFSWARGPLGGPRKAPGPGSRVWTRWPLGRLHVVHTSSPLHNFTLFITLHFTHVTMNRVFSEDSSLLTTALQMPVHYWWVGFSLNTEKPGLSWEVLRILCCSPALYQHSLPLPANKDDSSSKASPIVSSVRPPSYCWCCDCAMDS